MAGTGPSAFIGGAVGKLPFSASGGGGPSVKVSSKPVAAFAPEREELANGWLNALDPEGVFHVAQLAACPVLVPAPAKATGSLTDPKGVCGRVPRRVPVIQTVMEDGGLTVKQYRASARDRATSWEVLLRQARPLVHAVDALSAASLLHNDTHEDNIMFAPDAGVFRLIDFGLASLWEEVRLHSQDAYLYGTKPHWFDSWYCPPEREYLFASMERGARARTDRACSNLAMLYHDGVGCPAHLDGLQDALAAAANPAKLLQTLAAASTCHRQNQYMVGVLLYKLGGDVLRLGRPTGRVARLLEAMTHYDPAQRLGDAAASLYKAVYGPGAATLGPSRPPAPLCCVYLERLKAPVVYAAASGGAAARADMHARLTAAWEDRYAREPPGSVPVAMLQFTRAGGGGRGQGVALLLSKADLAAALRETSPASAACLMFSLTGLPRRGAVRYARLLPGNRSGFSLEVEVVGGGRGRSSSSSSSRRSRRRLPRLSVVRMDSRGRGKLGGV